ncbi:MAG: flavodoxin [Patescibacteria group bacterium]|nr:MAG: flavodoxin [Patescibacteria group bacterium]
MKAIVVYGSTAGNTRYLAEYVKLGLIDGGYDAEIESVKRIDFARMLSNDLIVLGSSTWNLGKEQGQLQHDWRERFEEFKSLNFERRRVGVFGVGHYHYTFTARAADILVESVKKSNGVVVEPIFKVDDVADLFSENIRAWAHGLCLAADLTV